MSDPVILSIVGGVQVIALAIIAKWHSKTQAAIEVIRKDVNGKMQELIEVSGGAREAKGKLAGIAAEKAGQ